MMNDDAAIVAVDVKRFSAMIDRGNIDDCWPYRGYIGKDGYGQFWVRGHGNVRAHRVALALHVGGIASGIVLHSCDNPVCCNPHHLRVGTHADNVRDRVSRGRSATSSRGNWRGGNQPGWLIKKTFRGVAWGKVGKRRAERIAYWRAQDTAKQQIT